MNKMGRARAPTYSDVIATLGNNKAASLRLLSSAKGGYYSTKDLLNRQTCQGILCLHLDISQLHQNAEI